MKTFSNINSLNIGECGKNSGIENKFVSTETLVIREQNFIVFLKPLQHVIGV